LQISFFPDVGFQMSDSTRLLGVSFTDHFSRMKNTYRILYTGAESSDPQPLGYQSIYFQLGWP
jgi:hypothetical protein